MHTWIFLRGLTRESRHWGDFATQFRQTLPDSQIIVLDLPGNGQLNQQRSPLRVQAMVAHCRTQLALRKLAPPYHVLAMSLGAMVAVAWADAHPQEVAANVLINTSMRPFNPFYQRLQPANYGVLLKLVLFGASPELWERTILRLTSNGANDEVLPMWLALRRDRPVSRANALRQLLAAAGFRASGVNPLTPTLLLASAQDQLVSVECSKTLARHWQCDLRLHPSAGHDLPLDDGPWVAAQVSDCLVHRPAALSQMDTMGPRHDGQRR
jgi:pimeloyl-ACP methyl ester carboxylesterase